jgi:hypothetical protein
MPEKVKVTKLKTGETRGEMNHPYRPKGRRSVIARRVIEEEVAQAIKKRERDDDGG